MCPRNFIALMMLVGTGLLVSGCGLFGDGDESPAELHAVDGMPDLNISSPSFQHGDTIPVEFTCDGENISPPLEWSEGPASTEEFVVIVDDPDAPRGVATHWIVIHIPPATTSIEQDSVPDHAVEAETRSGETGYRGPCPPEGEEHEYRFTVYAVDTFTDVSRDAGRNEVLAAIEEHIVAGGQFTGFHQRQ